MIIFKKVKWRNFLSTGDTPTEIDLCADSSTLVVGPNGSGKSTLLDALSFALFGKPHRDINKPQLVNSINDRNCEVEVEFSIGPAQFKIVRGLKPAKFEIYQNGVIVNQESHALDYQKVLEKNILKLNHKSFHQIVVLGSSSFIPFMQLPTQHRREVIDDLLDINIFTKMGVLLKEKTAKNREAMVNLSHELELVREKIKMQEKYIADLRCLNEEQDAKNQERISSLQTQISILMAENKDTESKIAQGQEVAQKELNRLHDRKNILRTYQTQILSNLQGAEKDLKFYQENDSCPTCSQVIGNVLREEKIGICTNRSSELQRGRELLAAEMEKLSEDITTSGNLVQSFVKMNSKIVSNNMTISSLQNQIQEIEAEIAKKAGSDILAAEQELSKMNQSQSDIMASRNTLLEEGTYNQAIGEMLKDTGIKTKVIRQYLPVMNKLINQYLNVLDFFVSFNLNEGFEETIKSRHRDDFSYASFSEGEKQRIDLSLLFTWRQIARMKNSVSTNLLVLDETFDSSMDADGLDNLIKILGTLEDNTNVFIISHKGDALDGKFKAKIEFEKIQNFSKVKVRTA